MNVNDIVEFKKTKNRYRIAGFGRMKVPGSKEWLDSVVYENFQDHDEVLGYVSPKEVKVYTREKTDFEKKFEPSIPKVQVFNTQDGRMIYDFGLPENVLARYFEGGFGLGRGLDISEEAKKNLPLFCQGIAGDILIGDLKKADNRISQKLLDAIRKDIKAGTFKKNSQGLAEIQNLLYFLSIPDDSQKEEPQKPVEVEDDETEEPLDPTSIIEEVDKQPSVEQIPAPKNDQEDEDDEEVDDEDEQE